MAEAEQARMVKASNANAEEDSSSKKKKPYLLLLSAVTRLVKWGDAQRARGSDLSLANREQSSQSNP
jgi:hypothetical protein